MFDTIALVSILLGLVLPSFACACFCLLGLAKEGTEHTSFVVAIKCPLLRLVLISEEEDASEFLSRVNEI